MKKYLDFVRELPCSHCGNSPTVAHHVIGIGMGKMGGKASDIHSMPLCGGCHNLVHHNPNEWKEAQVRWMVRTQEQAIDEGVLK